MDENLNLHVRMDGVDKAEDDLKRIAKAASATGGSQFTATDASGSAARGDIGDALGARDVADASKRVVEAFSVLGETGRRVTTTFSNLATLFRGTNFARALGIRPVSPVGADGEANAEGFARTLSRIMASRAVMGMANVGFEYAKNPLHDNYEINRAQRTANSAVTTLAATGSPLAAAIAGLTSFLQANVEKRNQLHTQEVGFQQQLIANRRQVEQSGGDWAFQQIQGMLSRPEQMRNLHLRANQIRGTASIDESYIPESMRGGEAGGSQSSATDATGKREVRAYSSLVGDAAKRVREATLRAADAPVAQYRDPDTGEIVTVQPRGQGGAPVAEASAATELMAGDGRASGYSRASKAPATLSTAPTGSAGVPPAKAPADEDSPAELPPSDADSDERNLTFRRSPVLSVLDGNLDLTEMAEWERSRGDDGGNAHLGYRIHRTKRDIAALGSRLNADNEAIAAHSSADDDWGDPDTASVSPASLISAAVAPNAQRVVENYRIRLFAATAVNGEPLTGSAGGPPDEDSSAAPAQPGAGKEPASGLAYIRKWAKGGLDDADIRNELIGDYTPVNPLGYHGAQLREIQERNKTFHAFSPNDRPEGGEWDRYRAELGGKAFESAVAEMVADGKAGRLRDIDLESLDLIRRYTPDNEKDSEWFKGVNQMYVAQDRRAAGYDMEAEKLRLDPSQVLNQYTDASRTTDAMARQGFFIGSQVDVQDVNKDILAESRKIFNKLEEMSKKQVSYSDIGFQANTNFGN